MCNTYMQEPPKGLKDFIFSYASNHEADDGSNAKFQRNGIKNTNMQSYDIHIYDCHCFAIYVQDYKIREQ